MSAYDCPTPRKQRENQRLWRQAKIKDLIHLFFADSEKDFLDMVKFPPESKKLDNKTAHAVPFTNKPATYK